MSAQGAAPEGGTSGRGHIGGSRLSIAQGTLPPHILERLAAEGVHSLADWRALGRRRFQLWGVTRRVVEQVDKLARGTP